MIDLPRPLATLTDGTVFLSGDILPGGHFPSYYTWKLWFIAAGQMAGKLKIGGRASGHPM